MFNFFFNLTYFVTTPRVFSSGMGCRNSIFLIFGFAYKDLNGSLTCYTVFLCVYFHGALNMILRSCRWIWCGHTLRLRIRPCFEVQQLESMWRCFSSCAWSNGVDPKPPKIWLFSGLKHWEGSNLCFPLIYTPNFPAYALCPGCRLFRYGLTDLCSFSFCFCPSSELFVLCCWLMH